MIAPDFRLKMTTGMDFHLYSALKSGPVVLNFIMGTWCPLCTSHLAKVRSWQKDKNLNKLSIIIVSNESLNSIRAWLKNNPSSFFYCSDENREVTKLFNLNMPIMNFSRPATILIDGTGEVRMKHTGIRNSNLYTKLEIQCRNCENRTLNPPTPETVGI